MIVKIDYTNWRGHRSFRRILPTGSMRFQKSDHHPDEQWVLDAYDLEKNELRTFALTSIHRWEPVSEDPGTREAAILWLRGGNTGTSSETIFEVMTGIPVKRHDIPYDPADFRRCRELLREFPEWRLRLGEVAARFPAWKPFVDNWDLMDKIYERDEPTEKSAELYELMMTYSKGHWTEKYSGKP